jgi:DNA polymerase type B, organellar and viral
LIQDVYFRAHTATAEKNRKNNVELPKWSQYVLVFDTETTLDTSQSLILGAYRFCEATSDGKYACLEEGLLHADSIDSKSLKILRAYIDHTAPDNPENGPAAIRLYSRSDFVEKVLWESVQAGAMVVGFNLPFDLSRLAVSWSKAHNGGWSLVLSLRRSRITGEMEPNPDRPRIRVTSKDSKSAFIALMRPRIADEWPSGRFLDLHTLASALHSESYSLDKACQVFGVPGKLKHEPNGKISNREIDYCRQDVRATTNLLNAMRMEFDLHPIRLQPERAYSPASIAKSYLDAMGIIPPKNKFKTPHRVSGIAMQAYYGGRAECRIRRLQVPIVYTDFTSQYPSVNALLGNGDILTAESLSFDDATVSVRKFLGKVSLENAFDPSFWKQLKFFALVKPDNDIFPVRAVYNGETQNIGVNRMQAAKPIWFAGPDIIASILLTGKIPRIEKAIRMVAHGKQKGLKSTKLRGMVTIDPKTDDFFRHVIEQRKRNKSNESLGHFLKILANAGSYGLFVELTPEKLKKPAKIKVFSGQASFAQLSNVLENQGRWYFPPIASLITAGGRLLLAMLETCVTDAGGSYLFCDTDSLCIVASRESELIPCPGGAHKLSNGEPAIKALTWKDVRDIANRFETLNPYDPGAVPGSILKIEDVNFDSAGNQRQLYGYAISAKRYAIYERDGKNLSIVDPKAHGLGYLYPPKNWTTDEAEWTSEAWNWLLRQALEMPPKKPAWLDIPAMMRIVLSTPHVLQRLNRSTRPFSFLFCPMIDTVAGYPAGVDPNRFTLLTPFNKRRSQWIKAKCVNVFDGKVYHLALRQSAKLDKAIPQTFGYVLRLYPCHAESKSLAPDGTACSADTCGLLQRASITAGTLHYVGKETDRHWEQGEDLSLVNFAPVEYSPVGKMIAADQSVLNELAKRGMREMIRETGLSQHTLEAIRRGQSVRALTLAILKRTLPAVR